MTTRFIVVRHGETEWNVQARIQGHGDSKLTEKGVAQAEAIAGRLAGEKFDAIVASDLGRALRTAQCIARGHDLEVRTDPRLRERSFGVGEGLSYDAIDAGWPDIFSRVRDTDPDAMIPGGESRRQFHERVGEAFQWLAQSYRGQRVAVVTHGGVLASLYRHIHAIPIARAHRIAISNASYNAVALDGATWTVEAWDDTSHLPGAEPFDDS